MELQTFFDEPVWRYAAGFAGSPKVCGSAYSWISVREVP